jgi:hypothetical protein
MWPLRPRAPSGIRRRPCPRFAAISSQPRAAAKLQRHAVESQSLALALTGVLRSQHQPREALFPPQSETQVELVAETHSCRGRRLQPAFRVCSKRHHSAVRHGNGPQSNLTAAPRAKKPCAEPVEIAPPPGIPALVPSNLLIWVATNLLFPAAGIPKRDERGWSIDVHALRHSFGTLLSKGGVAPRTAQAAMRHSDIALTMTTYTDPKLLDVQGALDALPSLPLSEDPSSERKIAKATGTGGKPPEFVAPAVAPTPGIRGQIMASTDTSPTIAHVGGSNLRIAENLTKPSKKASSAGIADKASQIGATRRLLNFLWSASGAGRKTF